MGTALLHIKAPTWSPQDAGISYDARALGVQWLPAAATAAGPDMPLFRGLVRACEQRRGAALSPLEPAAA